MATYPIDSDTTTWTGGWVDAAPFRAHLQHLMAVGQLSSAAAAVLTGISYRSAQHLLHGRGGRALRRISPDTARRLLSVTPQEACGVASRMVPAASTRASLTRLSGAGWTDEELAATLGVRLVNLAGLVDGRTKTCTQLVALKAVGETRAFEANGVLRPRTRAYATAA